MAFWAASRASRTPWSTDSILTFPSPGRNPFAGFRPGLFCAAIARGACNGEDRVHEPEAERWSKSVIVPGMWLDPDQDPREAGDDPAGERATCERYLRDYRLTIELKCQGLDAAQMASRPVPALHAQPAGPVAPPRRSGAGLAQLDHRGRACRQDLRAGGIRFRGGAPGSRPGIPGAAHPA